jgi:DNA polymerase-1
MKSAQSTSDSTHKLQNALFLIDASAFVFRAYYALQPLSSKGRPSHAVSGFASMLLKLIKDKQPEGCIVVFDSKKPSFRKEIYPDYKANRAVPPPDLSDQIVAIREMVRVSGLEQLQEEGVEADDLIASAVKKFKGQHKIVIVSSDKDLTQLIGDNVVLYDSFRDKIIDAAAVEEKWGVGPDQMRDLLSLMGDSSDNIPGLDGVGPKTASQLLKDYGSIDGLMQNQAKLSPKLREKVANGKETLDLSRRLVSLKEDLVISDKLLHQVKLPLSEALSEFLFSWDCQKILLQYGDLLQGRPEASQTVQIVSDVSKASLKLAESAEDLAHIEKSIQKAGRFVLDFETNSFNRQESKAVGYSVAWSSGEAWYVPWRHPGAKLPEAECRGLLARLLQLKDVSLIAHNLKFDLEVLKREGFGWAGAIEDTMLEGYLLHSDRRSFSLDNLSQEFLGERKGDLDSLLKDSEDFSTVSIEEAKDYAARDAHLTYLLHEKFLPEIEKNEKLSWLYHKVEAPLAEVLGSMESLGIKVSREQLSALSQELHKKLSAVEEEVYALAGEKFNINSPKQLQTILFDKLKLPATKKTKTGFSTDESVLQDLAADHPLPDKLLQFRSLNKLLSTYVDVLPDLVGSDGRIHTQYHQTGTATGRLSSSEPNLQNIPARTEEGMRIREAFIPEKGYLLMSADYSQVELRLFAHCSGDEAMIEAFCRGRDIHAETAKIIFGSDEKEFRSRAKAINFGIIYGISAFGLSQQLKISRSEAASFIESYFTQFPRLKAYMDDSVKRARDLGYTETLFGRKRPLPDIHSKNPSLRQFAERIAVNAPVQGTAADIMKAAMVRIFQRLRNEGLKSRMLLQVHDELVVEVLESERDQVQKMIVSEMEDLSKTPLDRLSVPLVVDSGFGQNWAKI